MSYYRRNSRRNCWDCRRGRDDGRWHDWGDGRWHDWGDGHWRDWDDGRRHDHWHDWGDGRRIWRQEGNWSGDSNNEDSVE